MTATGYSALENELKHRVRVERARLIQRIQEAIADDTNPAGNARLIDFPLRSMSKDTRYETDADSVVRLPPKNGHADQLDKAGHAILQLLHKAAGVAKANNQHALEMAQFCVN